VADYTSKYTGEEIDAGIERALNAGGKGDILYVTLKSTGWKDQLQTVTNSDLKKTGYCYIVAPMGDSYAAYTDAFVMAEDVATDGSITFLCGKKPTVDLNVQILKTEVN
jgi:hypothetical protein